VYVKTGDFTKASGTITGYASDQSNGNVVKAGSKNGHAVFAVNIYGGNARKETTAGPKENLSFSRVSNVVWDQ